MFNNFCILIVGFDLYREHTVSTAMSEQLGHSYRFVFEGWLWFSGESFGGRFLTVRPSPPVSASFATFEPCKSHAMHREVAATWLGCLIVMGRPNSDL